MQESIISGFQRDIKTGTVLNRNLADFNAYKLEMQRQQQQELIKKQVEELSATVAEIKDILKNMVCINGNSCS